MLYSQESVLHPVEDSYVYLGGDKAGNIYGTLNVYELITRRNYAYDEFSREAYCMFDFQGQEFSFSEIRLELYGNVVEAKRVEICATDTTWSEETLTGENRPTGEYIIGKELAPGETYYSWDLTQYVNNARAKGSNKISFIIKDVPGESATVDTKWHSKENPSGNSPRLILIPGDPPEVYNGNYYIDAVGGNDNNTGHSPEEAWKTLTNINNFVFQPGDSILFRAGHEWTGYFSARGSGLPGQPIVFGKYGGENRPVINGEGLAENTISLLDQHHIVIRDLAITNQGAVNEFRRAIYYRGEDIGEIPFLIFDNLEIYNVNGILNEKTSGGIIFDLGGSIYPTWLDTLWIMNCHIHDVSPTGIANISSWDNRELNMNENWTPSKNIHIHHNIFERTGQNALIVRVAHKPIMEFNLFDHCGILGSGNASYNFNTDSAIWQYNEARYTVYNEGDFDAGGFDSDYRSKNTIIQYNYSHHNEYGGILLTGGPGTGTGFNDGTIVRYNVFANNIPWNIRISGNATNTEVYNNVCYIGPEFSDAFQVFHKGWSGGYPDNTSISNNIFHNQGVSSSFDLTSSTNNKFSHNIYSGNSYLWVPDDDNRITEDPLLIDPGLVSDGWESVKNFELETGSPAIDAGIAITGFMGVDLAGNAVPAGEATDIGAFEYAGVNSIKQEIKSDIPQVLCYPNPVANTLIIQITDDRSGEFEMGVFNMQMKAIKELPKLKYEGDQYYSINLSHIPPGIYFLKLRINDAEYIKRIFKL